VTIQRESEAFQKRKDRFEFFETFEQPKLNLTFPIQCRDFRPYARGKNYPVNAVLLYHSTEALQGIASFRMRTFSFGVGEVIRPRISFTLPVGDGLFKFGFIEHEPKIDSFCRAYTETRDAKIKSDAFDDWGQDLSPDEFKRFIFNTTLKDLDFTSIQHPMHRLKSSDIPSAVFGKIVEIEDGQIRFSASLEAHHGFVDGYHVGLWKQELERRLNGI
jgi:chloramphenicol O-acetyltransferase type A